jgi:thioredoxin reductase (NADPH)
MARRPRTTHDLIIIGGGIAGVAAAHQAALRGLHTVCLEANLPGGLVANVNEVEGYPAGVPLSGIALADHLMQLASEAGAEFRSKSAASLDVADTVKSVETASGMLRAKAVVLATGARLRQLGVPGEVRLQGRGVSQCAFCDAGFFKDQEVVVVGGGDAAFQEALHLARTCSRVTMVIRGARPRARRHYLTRAAERDVFAFRWGTVVEEILGENGVEGVRLRRTDDGQAEELACHGVFPFIGSQSATDLASDAVKRDDAGALIVDGRMATSVPGMYAIGAARSGFGGQLTNAVSDATLAAMAVADN